jgi:alkanesulfonate monooxygenase SsuD/methylene tetrahydromethanopterin reductase-like flavin-dependent oxidoreductase (luciferase family)
MPDRPKMEFGYNPPSGERGREPIRPAGYMADLTQALDIATQGFRSIWVSDHLNYGQEWRLECWTLLSWVAARYPGVKLGTIVMSNTFRHPSLMAKMGASIQHMCAGRLILGYGAGWHEGEHAAFGMALPPPGERIDRLEEAVQVIKLLWTEAPVNFSGRYYRVTNAFATPRPDPRPPVMIGGGGERKTLRVVARHADWWNDVSRPMPPGHFALTSFALWLIVPHFVLSMCAFHTYEITRTGDGSRPDSVLAVARPNGKAARPRRTGAEARWKS